MAQNCTAAAFLLEVRYSMILPHVFSGALEACGGSRIAIYGNTSLANNRAYDYGGDAEERLRSKLQNFRKTFFFKLTDKADY